MRQELQWGGQRGGGLVDVLDRVLDKGLVIAGDIKISLADVELLAIRIRLIVCSLDKAEQVGLDWWKYDEHLAPGRRQLAAGAQPLAAENEALRKRIQMLERKVSQLTGGSVPVRPRTVESAGAMTEGHATEGRAVESHAAESHAAESRGAEGRVAKGRVVGSTAPKLAPAVPQRRARPEAPAGQGKH
jgi:hypothetical protein